jgi:ABC-type uncharacterized transport system fused permease/ATPase subunit
VGLLLCIPKYLAGTMTLGEVVQVSAAFVVVQGAFGWFTDNYARLAEWAASANRVASLLLALDEVDPHNSGSWPVTAAANSGDYKLDTRSAAHDVLSVENHGGQSTAL